MNEGLYTETYVHSRLTNQKMMQRRLMLAACIILPVLAIVASGKYWLVAIIVAVIADIVLVYYLPNPKVAYEYVFVDGQIDFDRIIAGTNRKTMRKTDLEQVEIVAPEGSHSLDSFGHMPLEDYSSGKEEDKQYILVTKADKGNLRIRFTPNEKILEMMKMKAKSKIEC